MAYFDIYIEYGSGFSMPSSAADGWIIGGAGETYVLTSDDGTSARFDISGSEHYDAAEVYYEVTKGTLEIWAVDFEIGGDVSLEIYFLEIEGPPSELSLEDVFSVALNLGDDVFYGTDKYADIIHAGPGDDDLHGFRGDDILAGDSGDDYIDGFDGKDVLLGGSGSDFLVSERGKDRLYGGPDADKFYFGKGFSRDTIKDIRVSQDTILIEKKIAKSFKKLKKVADEYSSGVVLEFSKKDQLRIEDIKLKELKAIDFDFV